MKICWVSITWLCSYIWTYSLLPRKNISVEAFIVRVHKNDSPNPNSSTQRWMSTCKIESASREKLQRHLGHSESDLTETNSDKSYELKA